MISFSGPTWIRSLIFNVYAPFQNALVSARKTEYSLLESLTNGFKSSGTSNEVQSSQVKWQTGLGTAMSMSGNTS